LVPPLLLGSAIGNVNTLVDRAVGSVVGDGAISALSYAWRLVSLGETLLVVSLVTALYPAFGAAAKRPEELRRLVGRGLATVAVMLAPVTAVLLVCATVVVSLVYEHGRFDGTDTALTVTAVTWYAPALLALGWREVAVRASYAVGDTRAPVVVAIGAMIVNVAGDLTLGLAFGIPGLAASTTLSLLLAAVANTWLLARRHAAVALRPLPGLLIRTTAAAAAGGVAGAVVVLLGRSRIGSWLGDVVIAVGAGIAVSAVFAGILFATRAPEATVLREAMRLLLRRR